MHIPDEMVKLDTSTMKKLEEGQVPGRKRKKIHGTDHEVPGHWAMSELERKQYM